MFLDSNIDFVGKNLAIVGNIMGGIVGIVAGPGNRPTTELIGKIVAFYFLTCLHCRFLCILSSI